MTAVDRDAVWDALHALVYGGEFAAWMRHDNPALPFAAAREYDAAVALMTRLVGHPPRSIAADSIKCPGGTD